jgi:hypothetical protein
MYIQFIVLLSKLILRLSPQHLLNLSQKNFGGLNDQNLYEAASKDMELCKKAGGHHFAADIAK